MSKPAKPKILEDVPAIPAAITLVVVLLGMFLGIFTYFAMHRMQQISERLEDRASTGAQIVSTNARWLIEVAEQTLRRVDAALGAAIVATPNELAPVLEGLPKNTKIFVVDAEARTLFATHPAAASVSVADRRYFTEVRDGATFYVSSLLVSRLDGDNVFVVSKRIERDGKFAGAAMASFSTSVLADFWTTLEVEEASTISLLRTDGMLIGRYPPTKGPMDLSHHILFTEHFPKSPSGTYTASSPVDGVDRLVSYRHVPGTQMIAVASLAAETAWQALFYDLLTVLLIASPVVIGLALGGSWIVRLLYRDASHQRELEAALAQNVLLFRETHHRVKNNLQSVQSLVRMQDIPKSIKLDLLSRFAAMAAMHQHIYTHDAYTDIVATDFVPSIVDTILRTYSSPVSVSYDIDPVHIDRDHGTPISLLLSELVTNALKYAFLDGREGCIRIEMKALNDKRCRLVVEDNGIGFAPPGATTSMGLRLIEGIVGQMDGTHRFTTNGGTRFEADLALEHAARTGRLNGGAATTGAPGAVVNGTSAGSRPPSPDSTDV